MIKILKQFSCGVRLAMGGLVIATGGYIKAGTFSSNFDSDPTPLTSVRGSAYWSSSGGASDSGVIHLTDAFNSQEGSLFIDDLDNGAEITGFTAQFKMRIGGGTTTPADGLSFSFANDLYYWYTFGEEGAGSGLSICFDTYDNGGGEAPSIDVKKAGVVIASAKGTLGLFHTDAFVDVLVQAHPGGTLDLSVNGTPVFTGLPSAFDRSAGQFAFGARTGSLNDNHWIDDVNITTTSAPPDHPFVVSTSPTGTGVNEDAAVQVVLGDGVQQVVPASIVMKFNGATVTPTVSKSAGQTTVSYDPPGSMPSGAVQKVSVTFSDNGSPATTQVVSYSFETRYIVGPTGNLYELVVSDFGYTWDEANFEAQTRTWFGRPGHLATLTSYEEDLFANKVRETSLNGVASEVWIGGFQDYGMAPKDGWHWVNNEGPISGANGGPTYSNWRGGEPNDYNGQDSENYLSLGLFGEFVWNDSGYFGYGRLAGYIVEYEALQVTVDIKPGSFPNVVNVQDSGKLPVAVLSSPTFDASTINVKTLRFGRTGVEATPVSSSLKDVNGDGKLDLQLSFNTQDIGWRCGDTSARLIARAKDGTPLAGVDSVQLIGCPSYGLAVNALLDVNHKTDVQLQVSPLLPGYTAPNRADQVVLKSYKISGQLGWSKTLTSVPLTPSGSSSVGLVTFSDLQRGQKIDAKVNVTNSKTKQTEILRADGRVLARPDLALGSAIFPPNVKTYQLVNISAPVNELQGDLGAKASASLLVDGTVVDTVNGLNVAAGGQAGLVFTTRLQTDGIHTLKIALNNVTPGDYDYSNNEVTFQIQATQPSISTGNYDMSYFHSEFEYGRDWDNDFSTGSEHYLYKYEAFTENLSFPQALTLPAETIAVTLNVDGAPKLFNAIDNVGFIYYDDGCIRYGYGSAQIKANTWVYVQSNRDCNYGYELTSVQVNNYAYRELYFSTEYFKWWGYSSAYNYDYSYGDFWDATTSIDSRVILRTPEGDFGGNAEIPSANFYYYSDYYPYEIIVEGGWERGFNRSVYASGWNYGTTTP